MNVRSVHTVNGIVNTRYTMITPNSVFFSCSLSSSSDIGIVSAVSGIICTISTATTNTRRPAKRNRAIASAPKKPTTRLIETVASVMTRLLSRSSRKIGSVSTPLEAATSV